MCVSLPHRHITQHKFKTTCSLSLLFYDVSDSLAYKLFTAAHNVKVAPCHYEKNALTHMCHISKQSYMELGQEYQRHFYFAPCYLLPMWLLGLHNERLSPRLSPLLHLPVRQWELRL